MPPVALADILHKTLMRSIHLITCLEDSNRMATLLIGFLALVLVPALILSVVMAKLMHRTSEFGMHDDYTRFTISQDT